MGGNVQEQMKPPIMRVVQGGSQPALSSMQAKAILNDRISPEMRERGAKAIAGLQKMLEEDFTKQEQGFKRSLVMLKETISGLLCGTAPDFRKYDREAISALVSRNHDIKLSLSIEDGKPVLCPELESAIGTMLYMMNEYETKRVGLLFGKENDNEHQIIIISGASIKNFSRNVLPAVRSAVELAGCEFRPNGASVTMLVPLQPNSQTAGAPLPI